MHAAIRNGTQRKADPKKTIVEASFSAAIVVIALSASKVHLMCGLRLMRFKRVRYGAFETSKQ